MLRQFLPQHVVLIFLAVISLTLFSCNNKRSGKARVLVFSKTAGYHHASIDDGNRAIAKLGAENDFIVDTTTDATMFNEDTLKNYAAVIFLSATGDLLDYRQEAAFERYIQAGGGYVGIHAAADAEYGWNWYGRLAGAYFLDHPSIQDAILRVTDTSFQATQGIPSSWKRADEYYNFKQIGKDIHVVMTIDEATYEGGHNGANHPVAWYHGYDGGRAFYTALGHTAASYTDPLFLKHLLGGINYAIGDNESLDYNNSTTQLPPEEDRFTKTPLVTGTFFEPTEMTILPNLDILVLQRRGEILLYKQAEDMVKQAGFLNVYFQSTVPGVNVEEGLLGLAKDPDFEKNQYVYIYYSAVDAPLNRLSRFVFANDTLDAATEKVILEVKTQRDICCHTGGSIAFGPDKLLYFSAGDNSTPFNENGQAYTNQGYAPLNDLPGHLQYDARRSAGNSNDLRGKIMRLSINPDGTYSIPDGNLFPKGTPGTRPEIYVMGNRNPYRISVDQKNSFLYWGEVGPDANRDSLDTRGPMGYDEVNQARRAGNFGWPYFVGNNTAYHEYNYATGESGPAFNPGQPVNNSRNNTGLAALPAAQPAFIWYPYGQSADFPEVGAGGRTAMAGPVFYTDLFPSKTRMPDYYNGKLFIYDFIRGWIKAVTLTDKGDFEKMEPFLPGVKMNSLIDMEMGPDGRLYLLEYGDGWFKKNPDAAISRIDYNAGNRPPKITGIAVDKKTGVLPFTVTARVTATDPEKDKMSYTWDFGNGQRKETAVPEVTYTFTTPGDYNISAIARDDKGAEAKSTLAAVYAGNNQPVVRIQLAGNQSFYFPGKPVQYQVRVEDQGDTASTDPANLFVSVDYVEGVDKAQNNMGHQQVAASIQGKALALSLDCKSCHKEAEASVGPAFEEVSRFYARRDGARQHLVEKIIGGGGGVWGEVMMPAHPNLLKADAQQIVTWILALAKSQEGNKSLPGSGSIVPAPGQPTDAMIWNASYTDHGGNAIKALTGSTSVSLRSNTLFFTDMEQKVGFRSSKEQGMLVFPEQEGVFALPAFDLANITSLTLFGKWPVHPDPGFTITVTADKPEGGLVLGTITARGSSGRAAERMLKIPLSALPDGKQHKLYFTYKASQPITGGITKLRFDR